MIRLFFTNIDHVNDQVYREKLSELPIHIQKDIDRYVVMRDKKLRLFGRLMLDKYLGIHVNSIWDELQVSPSGKPFINNAPFFNISHSKSIVLFAYAQTEIGVDIEEIVDQPFKEIATFFHPSEIESLEKNQFDKHLFFSIWTRKESLLKGIGTGIVSGLSTYNCLNDEIFLGGKKWNIRPLKITEGYSAAVCLDQEIDELEIKELTINDFT